MMYWLTILLAILLLTGVAGVMGNLYKLKD